MLRRSILAALVWIAGACALAAGAAADELGLVVERTTPTQKNVPVTVQMERAGKIEVLAYRVGAPDALFADDIDLGTGRALAPFGTGRDADAARQADPTAAAAYQRAALELVAKRRIEYRIANKRHMEVIRFERPGLYLLEARSRGMVARATAVVSDLALVVKRAPGRTLVWAVNRRTGAPWEGVALRAGVSLTDAGTTGADGTLALSGTERPTLRLVASAGDHLAFGEETYFPTVARDRRVYACPHQPAYRPGERAEIYGIVRAYEDGAYRLDPGVSRVSLRLLDARGNVAAESDVAVSSDLGTFRHGFDLDAKAPTGDWKIVVGIGDDEYEAPLKVAAYRKPAFEVKVKPRTRRVLAGEAATYEVRASFYDGGVVAGAKVTWQLVYNRVDRELFPTDELVKVFFGTEREAYQPETVQTGKGVLDATGRLKVATKAPPAALDGYLTLRATVFGPDRIAVAGSGGVSVAAAPVRVDLETDKHLYGPEDQVRVTIKVETADGKPAASRAGVFTLAHLRTDADGRVTETWTQPRRFEADERGEVDLQVTLPREGRFRFMAVVPRLETEPTGSPAEASVHAWALPDKPTLGANPGPLDVVADKDHYAVGDTARFLVRAPGSGRSVLAAVEGATLLSHEVLGGASIWTVRIEPDHAPNVFATFATVYRGELMLETRMLRVPPVRRLLTTTIEPDSPEVEPGATTGATVRVTDHDGQPVANAELAVAFVDEALYGLYADPAEPIEPFFHSLRRNNVRTGGLLHHSSMDFVRQLSAKKAKRDGGPDPVTGVPAPAAAPTSPAPSGGAEPEEERASGEEAPERSEEMEDHDETEAEDAWAARRPPAREGRSRRMGLVPAKKPRAKNGLAPQEARKDFRSCVFWSATLRTDAEGKVRIDDVKLADALTRWRIAVRAVDAATRVGSGRATFVAKKNLAVSVAPPRFLRAGDRVEIPLLVRNLTKQAVDAVVTWWTPLRDPSIPYEEVADSPANGPSDRMTVAVAPGATERRIVPLSAPGVSWASVHADAKADAGSDAVVRTFPVLPQGIEKTIGRIIDAPQGAGSIELRVPEGATPGTISGRVSVESSSVQAVVAALPYLLDYPHGCTEQTMNRFGPLLEVQAAMKALGVPERGRLLDVPDMLAAGLARLAQLQHSDGGFGWWESDPSSPVMTALVVRGLRGIETAPAARLRTAGTAWLVRWWKASAARVLREDAATVASVALAVLESGGELPKGALEAVLDSEQPYASSPITRAWFLRAAHAAKKPAWVAELRKRLIDSAQRDKQHAWWPARLVREGNVDRGPTRWQDDPIEATAEVLYALQLTSTGDDAELLQRGARWLVANRTDGDRWRSTRDTAAAVRFLAAHAITLDDLGTGRPVSLRMNGKEVGSVYLTKESLFDGSSIVALPADRLKPGAVLDLSIVGNAGPFLGAVTLRYFEAGPAIRASSNGLEVTRRWYRLDPVENGGGVTWTRTPVTETVASGTLLECELVVKSPKAREYVMVQDPFAAGFEPEREYGMDVKGRRKAADAQIERYDDRVLFFVTNLPVGETVLRHVVRATHVGDFTALPAQAELMYFPAVRGNSDGEPLQVSEAGPTGVKGDR